MRTCNEVGCDEKHRAKGYCIDHYNAHFKSACSQEGCDTGRYAKGLCRYHYFRRLNGTVTPPYQKRECSEKGCTNIAIGRKLCNKHFSKEWRTRKALEELRKEEQVNTYKSDGPFFTVVDDTIVLPDPFKIPNMGGPRFSFNL